MQSLSSAGAVYRTRLLTPAQAARFAKCLTANPHFSGVQVEESPRSPGKAFVAFVPVSAARRAEMLAREAGKRRVKAQAEGQDYLFALDPDSPQPFAWCFNPNSGETYEVTAFDCTCPDFRYRCRGVGIRCKHMLALSEAAERVQPFSTIGQSTEEEPFDPRHPFGPVTEDPEFEAEYRELLRLRAERDLLWPDD